MELDHGTSNRHHLLHKKRVCRHVVIVTNHSPQPPTEAIPKHEELQKNFPLTQLSAKNKHYAMIAGMCRFAKRAKRNVHDPDVNQAQKKLCRFSGSNAVPPDIMTDHFSLALSQLS
jgi:hypothetical protein